MTLVDLDAEGLNITKSSILKSFPAAGVNIEVGNTTVQSFTEHMVASTVSMYGRLDYAVNCGGTLGSSALSHEVDLEEHDRVMNVNYQGTMFGNEPLTTDDSHSQRGAIVNIASTWGMVGARGFCEYPFQIWDASERLQSRSELLTYYPFAETVTDLQSASCILCFERCDHSYN